MEELKPGEIAARLDSPAEERQAVQMQRVFIQFSNGKTAVFSGPAVFSSAELKLTQIQIADIVFSEPYEVQVRVPVKETPNETK